MPRVLPSAPLLGSAASPPRAPSRSPSAHSPGGALRRWDRAGFLQLQVGRHPPGHVTGEGAAPAGGLEPAFRGPSLLLEPSALGRHPRPPREAGPGGSLRVSLGLKSGEGPPSAGLHMSAGPTPVLRNTGQKSTFFSANSRAYRWEGLSPVSPSCIREQLEPGFLRESFIFSSHSDGAFRYPGFWPRRCDLGQTPFPPSKPPRLPSPTLSHRSRREAERSALGREPREVTITTSTEPLLCARDR
ncbi:uncharacterized protein [Equus przewalskii]|uniref:Uncharacterized protein n=1 Tax=Equus przewalskii TaxID=9798 RepID=A0ABM4PYY8_EQUPR